jgi:hypothetical protein
MATKPEESDALRALEDASVRAPLIRLELDAAYLQAIAVVESLDTNQSGADKTWVGEAEIAFRRHYENARRS